MLSHNHMCMGLNSSCSVGNRASDLSSNAIFHFGDFFLPPITAKVILLLLRFQQTGSVPGGGAHQRVKCSTRSSRHTYTHRNAHMADYSVAWGFRLSLNLLSSTFNQPNLILKDLPSNRVLDLSLTCFFTSLKPSEEFHLVFGCSPP